MILKCCIIYDEPLAIVLLESYVKKTPFLQLEASFTSAVQAIERISKGGKHSVNHVVNFVN